MKSFKPQMICVIVILGAAIGAIAQETSIKLPPDNPMSQLKAGPGMETIRRDCSICHSTDYIVIQRTDAQHWAAEVKKMMAVYGAPISASDAKIISDYLATNYATHNPATAEKVPSTQP